MSFRLVLLLAVFAAVIVGVPRLPIPDGKGLSLIAQVSYAFLLAGAGWLVVSAFGEALRQKLIEGRIEAAAVGTIDFVLRLTGLLVIAGTSLSLVGLNSRVIALGGAAAAVLIGLAAQQTLGNLFAGVVINFARPVRRGDWVRLSGGMVGAGMEGRVWSLGLMYTVVRLEDGNHTMIPNAALLSASVTPVHQTTGVDFTARLRPGVVVTQVVDLLRAGVRVPTRTDPQVDLESLEDQLVVRIRVAPQYEQDGAALADEVLRAIRTVTEADDDMPTTEFAAIQTKVAVVAEERAEDRPEVDVPAPPVPSRRWFPVKRS